MVGRDAGTSLAVVAGTTAAAYSLAGGRWGAYLAVGPVFVTDILVALACLALLLRVGLRGRWIARTGGLAIPVLALLAWTAVRLVLGGRADLIALRDAAPYLYAVMGLVGGVALANSTARQRERTATVVSAALAFHTAWVFLVTILMPSVVARMPTLSEAQDIRVFTLRPDFDIAITGAFVAYWLSRLLHTGVSWRAALALGAGIPVIMLGGGSRAGMLGALTPCVLFAVWQLRRVTLPDRARSAIVGIAFLALIPLAWVGATTGTGQRLLAGIGIDQGSARAANAVGTLRAREQAWQRVTTYAFERPERLAAGVGFGPDYMEQSGALYRLVGPRPAEDVRPRSPHSWWLGTLVRLGLVGFLCVAFLVARTLFRALASSAPWSRAAGDFPRLYVLSVGIFFALLLPASLGVVLESPFGAVPFFWCVGIILAWGGLTTQPRAENTRSAAETGARGWPGWATR